MRREYLINNKYRNLLLERRLERAFSYAIRKGLSPVEHMKKSLDMLVEHLFRMKAHQGPVRI